MTSILTADAQATPRNPGLVWVTFLSVGAIELTDIAARLQCGSVTLLGHAPVPGVGRPIAPNEVATICSTLAAGGMMLSSFDLLPITPDFDPGAHDSLLELGGALGAQRIGTVMLDPDGRRAADNMRQFAERARTHGLLVGVEFVSFTPLRTLSDAVALIDRVADPGVKIIFDTLHFARTGGRAADLDEDMMNKIGNVQICDGPEHLEADRLRWEATTQRMLPGSGSFDLQGVFARLPADLLIDIEVPMKDMDDQASRRWIEPNGLSWRLKRCSPTRGRVDRPTCFRPDDSPKPEMEFACTK